MRIPQVFAAFVILAVVTVMTGAAVAVVHAQPPEATGPDTFQVKADEKAVPPRESLEAILVLAGRYVVEFQRQLSGIVAQERYVQDVRPGIRQPMGRAMANDPVAHRELTSDFLLVKPVGSGRWVDFRDVFEVDGKPIRDRDERLMKLFLDPKSDTRDQVQRIIAESTRYNIGNMQRTVNVPVLPLAFLDPEHQARFRFTRTSNASPRLARPSDKSSTTPRFLAPDAAWVVAYDEVEKDTMIRTTNNRDLPARGRFWIEPATGRVLMSELVAQSFELHATIGVSYQSEPLVGLLVPAEMREYYQLRRDNTRIDGTATYSRFRQFQVKVDEKIAPIVKP